MSILKNVAIGLDQTFNCVVKLSDGWGDPDEMLSARAWRLRKEHPCLLRFIDWLFCFDDNHCQECYEIERKREQLSKDYQP